MSLECYWKLVSTAPEERTRAALELIASLTSGDSSANHHKAASTSPPAALSPDVDYAIKRLVRGLSSSTDAARQGFAACLAEILAALPHVPLSLVQEHMVASTEVTGSVRGQEERDMLLGRLFTCLAVARSGRLASDQEWEPTGTQLLETAITIFSKRKVLRSLAAETVVALVECMPPKRFCASAALVTQLGQSLGCVNPAAVGAAPEGQDTPEELGLEALNPDQLAVGLAVQAYMRRHHLLKHAALQGKLPQWLLTSKRILKGKRVPKLLEPLKASSSAFPRMHPVWDRILGELIGAGTTTAAAAEDEEDEESSDKTATLQVLWGLVVDGVLACGTHERKALSLMLLQRVCGRASATTQLPICLSPHVLKVLLSSLATTGTADEILRPLAKQTVEMLLAAGEDEPEKRLVVASALLTRCDVNFDLKTGTKTVQGLLDGLGMPDLLAFVRHLARAYEDADTPAPAGAKSTKKKKDEEAAQEEAADRAEEAAAALPKKLWAVDALYALTKTPVLAGPEGTGIILQVLRLLLSLAYFNTESFEAGGKKDGGKKKKSKKGPGANDNDEEHSPASWILIKVPVPSEVRKVAGARLHSLLADLGKRAALRFDAPEGGLGSLGWLWATHEAWRGLEGAGAELAHPLSGAGQEARATMLGLVGDIRARVAKEEDKMAAAFAALIMQIGLHQLSLTERGDEEDFLGDLCRCYGDLVGKAAASKDEKTKKGKKQQQQEEDDEVDAMAVLADVCIGALSTTQEGMAVRGLRDVIRKAWALVCTSCPLTRPALDVLLGVVCDVSASAEEEEDSDDEGSSSEEDDDEDDEAALATLDKALKSAGVSVEEEGSDSEEESGEEENEEEDEIMVDANDSAAFRRLMGGEDENQAHLDHMLALRQSNGQGSKESRLEAERLSLQHRLRTLDLLDVVAAKQPNAALLLLAIRPCLKAVKTLQAQAGPGKPSQIVALSHRLEDFLTKRLAKTRPKLVTATGEAGAVADAEVQAIAQDLMAGLKKAPSTAQTNVLLACLVICTRAVVSSTAGTDSAVVPWLSELYREGLTAFMTTRSALTAAPFEQLVARFPSLACLVLLDLLNRYAVEASKSFRQAEAFRMIGLLLAQRRVMAPEAKAMLARELGPLLVGLTRVLQEQAGELNSKRLKPLVDCCQAVATVLKDETVTGMVGASSTEDKKASKKKGGKKGAAAETVDTAQAALQLGRVLLEVQGRTGSDGIQKSCAHVASELGVPSSPTSTGEKGEKSESAAEKSQGGTTKAQKKLEKKRKHAQQVSEHKAGGGKDNAEQKQPQAVTKTTKTKKAKKAAL